jgi:hypothetical protein
LIGSLLTCEIAINERTDKKAKSIAFITNAEDEEELKGTWTLKKA